VLTNSNSKLCAKLHRTLVRQGEASDAQRCRGCLPPQSRIRSSGQTRTPRADRRGRGERGNRSFRRGGGIPGWRAHRCNLQGNRRLFVKLYRLQEDTLGQIDFDVVARAEGKLVLLRRHGAMLSKHYGAAVLDAALDEIVARPLDVLRKVTARERARMN